MVQRNKENVQKRWFNIIGRLKVYIQRAASYVTLLNTGMLMFLMLDRIGVEISSDKIVFFSIYVGTFLLLLLAGFIDDKAGFHRREAKYTAGKNPYFKKILNAIEELKKHDK